MHVGAGSLGHNLYQVTWDDPCASGTPTEKLNGGAQGSAPGGLLESVVVALAGAALARHA